MRWFVRSAAALALCLAGCQMPSMRPKTPPPAPAPGAHAIEDPCPERMGDICTRLLLYYSTRHELPARLEDLSDVGPRIPLRLTCPVSGRAYQYFPQGMAVSGTERRIVVQDPTACHAGIRYVIAADPAKPGRPRVIQVLRLSGKAELLPN